MDEPSQPTPPEAQPEQGYEAPAPPPDIGDAIQQMHARNEELQENGFAQEPYAEEAGYELGFPGEDQGYQPGYEELSPEDAIQQLVDQRVNDHVGHWESVREGERRENEIRAFAQEHPRLAEPDVIESVGGFLDGMAQELGDDSIRSHPALIKIAYFATRPLPPGLSKAATASPRRPASRAP